MSDTRDTTTKTDGQNTSILLDPKMYIILKNGRRYFVQKDVADKWLRSSL